MKGKGNYKGERDIKLIITEKVLMSKVSISSVKAQTYTGDAIEPEITVKQGKNVLKREIDEDEDGTPEVKGDYTVTYTNNTKIGTATVTVTATENSNYIGQKQITFKINGTAISKAKITGIPKSVVYTGEDIEAGTLGWDTEPVLKVTVDKQDITLEEGKDYLVSYNKNLSKGKGTIIFTGINGYSGTVKKTFTISPYNIGTDLQDEIAACVVGNAQGNSMSNLVEVVYEKGGSKPEVLVLFKGKRLTLGTDYTVSYKNNTAVNDGSNPKKVPYLIITGKGNFTGSIKLEFAIVAKDISDDSGIAMIVADKVYQKKKNGYKSTPKLLDKNGKVLGLGTDYLKNIEYFYKEGSTLPDDSTAQTLVPVGANDIPVQGTVIVVKVTGTKNYKGTMTAEYRLVGKDISKARVAFLKQMYYTGAAITPRMEDVKVTFGKENLTDEHFEIIGYSNNVKKGTATMTIQGKGEYGGTKTVKFNIKSQTLSWW